MQLPKNTMTPYLSLIFFSILLSAVNPAVAESDKQMQDKLLRAREMTQLQGEHAGHANNLDNGPDFRGIYYGYFPCKEEDCSGIKITLSLKRNNNYLLVTQPAKPSSREFFEKGKFIWNDDTRTVVLTPKDKPTTGQYRIVDEGTLVQLNPDGSSLAGDQDDYTLRRGDTVKSREVHIH
jgi:copper homeostasis protein (lipoprotein)